MVVMVKQIGRFCLGIVHFLNMVKTVILRVFYNSEGEKKRSGPAALQFRTSISRVRGFM